MASAKRPSSAMRASPSIDVFSVFWISKFEVEVCLFGCEAFSLFGNVADDHELGTGVGGYDGRTLARGSEASAGAFEDEDVTTFEGGEG